jgi:hypothetical protein
MYAIYNPPIGYLQGMNDLFVPLILTFISGWSEDGEPIDIDRSRNLQKIPLEFSP